MNRAMLLTGSGSAAIAVVRMEGSGVEDFLQQCFDRAAKPGACVYGRIRDGERILDDAMVALHENGADLNLHGGIWTITEVINLLARHGFEVVPYSPEQTWAADGETELEREIAAYLPFARSELAISTLLHQRQAWDHFLSSSPSRESAEKILADRALHYLLHPPSVAIGGLPNVGKSTLANQLFGQQRSITADIPGTTRDWVGELANIDGLIVKLIDTPGQRTADDEIETRAICAAASVIASAELVVLVLDPTQERESQMQLASRWPTALVVINKSDLGTWQGADVRTVASTGIGLDELCSQIRQHFGVLEIDESVPRCWTNRQREEIELLLHGNSTAKR